MRKLTACYWGRRSAVLYALKSLQVGSKTSDILPRSVTTVTRMQGRRVPRDWFTLISMVGK